MHKLILLSSIPCIVVTFQLVLCSLVGCVGISIVWSANFGVVLFLMGFVVIKFERRERRDEEGRDGRGGMRRDEEGEKEGQGGTNTRFLSFSHTLFFSLS